MEENSPHPEADVCTDPNHCQAYLDDGDLRKKWGILNFWRYKSKIEAAVNSTRGLVLTYQGKLIDPVYHANGGGRTEKAVHVWGKEVPYLQSVPSPWDEGDPNYQRILTFTFRGVAGEIGGPGSAGGRQSPPWQFYRGPGEDPYREDKASSAWEIKSCPEVKLESSWACLPPTLPWKEIRSISG